MYSECLGSHSLLVVIVKCLIRFWLIGLVCQHWLPCVWWLPRFKFGGERGLRVLVSCVLVSTRQEAASVRVSSLPPPNLKSPSQDFPYSSFCLVHLSRMINAIVVVEHCPLCRVYLLFAWHCCAWWDLSGLLLYLHTGTNQMPEVAKALNQSKERAVRHILHLLYFVFSISVSTLSYQTSNRCWPSANTQ